MSSVRAAYKELDREEPLASGLAEQFLEVDVGLATNLTDGGAHLTNNIIPIDSRATGVLDDEADALKGAPDGGASSSASSGRQEVLVQVPVPVPVPLPVDPDSGFDSDVAESTVTASASPVEAKATIRSISMFAIPAMAVWLCSPVLSLIDTSAVGVFSGTIQQAALSPAVAITDYAALLLAFMFTGTTNLIAGKSTVPEVEGDVSPAAKILLSCLQMSLLVGSLAGVTLWFSSATLLNMLMGKEAERVVFSAALKYVRIRALGLPAAVVIGSAQAACLGLKDIRSPLIVLLAAALVNGLCDALLVPCKFALFNGAAGAAWATVFSQYFALALFSKWLRAKKATLSPSLPLPPPSPSSPSFLQRFKLEMPRISRRRRSNPPPDENVKPREEAFSTKGIFDGKYKNRDILRRAKDGKDFLPFFVPVTTTQVGRISGYVAMNHVVASSMGPISMAAQQIMLAVFYTFTPMADSLSLTGQAFVPGLIDAAAKSANEEGFHGGGGSAASKKLTQYNTKLWQTGVLFGAIMAAASSVVPLFSYLFTHDPLVQAKIAKISPIMALVFVVHGCVCGCEGIMLGMRDLKFISLAYAFFFFSVPAVMLRVKATILGGSSVGLRALWKVFLGYNITRFVVWSSRVAKLNWNVNRGRGLCQDGVDGDCAIPNGNTGGAGRLAAVRRKIGTWGSKAAKKTKVERDDVVVIPNICDDKEMVENFITEQTPAEEPPVNPTTTLEDTAEHAVKAELLWSDKFDRILKDLDKQCENEKL